MRRFLLIFLISVVGAGCSLMNGLSRPQTPLEISGVLSGKRVLEGQVIMVGDLLVPTGSSLIIRPGTTIVVRNSESTKIDPEFLSAQTELLVRGRLVIEGRPDALVSFIPKETVAAGEIAWAGIILDGASDSSIRNTTIIQAETGIQIINSSPEVTGNKISKARYGIIIQGGSAKILGNEINLSEGGIFCWNGAKPYLKDNYILANAEEGIVVDRSSRPYLDRNTIVGNSLGLVVPDNVPFDPTMIVGNKVDIQLLEPRQEAGQ